MRDSTNLLMDSRKTDSVPAFALTGGIADLPQWYAVQTRSRFEKMVQAELSAKSIENYLPVSRELHQWKDRKKAVDTPLFPGYVFARIVDTPADRIRVLQTTGAAWILGAGGAITPIPDGEIEAVKRLMETPRYSAHPYVREGMRVRVCRGPLCGIEGFVVRTNNSTRLVISIQLLARSVAAEVDRADLKILF